MANATAQHVVPGDFQDPKRIADAINQYDSQIQQISVTAAHAVKGNPTGSSGPVQDVTPIVARSSSLLNIESSTSVGDTDYTILSTDRFVLSSAPFTANRTWTLPASSSVNHGTRLIVWPWGTLGAFTITIQVAGGSGDLISFPQVNNFSSVSWLTNSFLEFVSSAGNWVFTGTGFFSATNPGIVLPSGGGTTNFLRADNSFTTSAPITVQRFTGGSGNYTPTSGTVRIRVQIGGAGGGGGAQATNAGSTAGSTTFGGWSANGGAGGPNGGANTAGGAGATGGSNGTGTLIRRTDGSRGGPSVNGGQANLIGAGGACSLFGLTTPVAQNATAGTTAPANSGAGGAGGGNIGTATGGGGGGGETVEFWVNSPGVIPYSIAGGGNGGTAGTVAGGKGSDGTIIIEEYYF